ncbi:hypothetical protein VTN49DRAFT_7189 [Thermomyces lanuginosus]|uniref:uncharacterized protein n=1 Tax=Thermomyces lanuginosus TaxID=5541 RepID=UPI00374272AF
MTNVLSAGSFIVDRTRQLKRNEYQDAHHSSPMMDRIHLGHWRISVQGISFEEFPSQFISSSMYLYKPQFPNP